MPHTDAREGRKLVAKLLGFVDGFTTRIGASRNAMDQREYDRTLSVLQERFGAAELSVLTISGSDMTLDEAVEQAFSV